MTKYTKPKLEKSYDRQYPDMIEFEKPWEKCIQVGQSYGKISKKGKTLQSEGFGRCFGLILKNHSNLESALFHVDDIDLNQTQTEVVNEFIKDYINDLKISRSEREKLIETMKYITKYKCPDNYGKMKREDFQLRMQELNSDETIKALFVRGDVSRDVKNRIIGSLFGFLGIKVIEDLVVNTEGVHWAMIYKPNESKIYIDARNQKKVLQFNF